MSDDDPSIATEDATDSQDCELELAMVRSAPEVPALLEQMAKYH